jgi:hypothetical protein
MHLFLEGNVGTFAAMLLCDDTLNIYNIMVLPLIREPYQLKPL